MSLPKPEPGLVISYAYLWRHEHNRGQEEGRKHRPCVIVLAVEKAGGRATRVTVAAVTHTPPTPDAAAVEMPQKVKQHLGLDDAQSWIIVNEVNQFDWPGFDLRPLPGQNDTFAYGFIPPRLYEAVKATLLETHAKRTMRVIPRD
ncbi:type II toxin-antitoxin system PemK/MazF family toxin [Komagataeibacter saccharivorans]|uniref:type II toxin-antitoxin system PemK/MazF family toxin n=1 Tax=Komagataeibacter saccharivorans TaxID=265959 RepID=UPI0024A86714|nr:type II toxin-antitoxin system PemK/MazF family toxin [Komagataeibacter saccharivorans]